MQISSYGNASIPRNFRKYQNNAALINVVPLLKGILSIVTRVKANTW